MNRLHINIAHVSLMELIKILNVKNPSWQASGVDSTLANQKPYK